MSAILSLLKIPSVLFIVVLKSVVGVPAGVFHAMFTMVNLERFELTPESNGKLLSYVGIITMVSTFRIYHTHTHAYIYTYTHAHIHTNRHTHTHTHTLSLSLSHTNTHTHTHTHTHTANARIWRWIFLEAVS